MNIFKGINALNLTSTRVIPVLRSQTRSPINSLLIIQKTPGKITKLRNKKKTKKQCLTRSIVPEFFGAWRSPFFSGFSEDSPKLGEAIPVCVFSVESTEAHILEKDPADT